MRLELLPHMSRSVTTMPEKNFGMRLSPDERREIERLAEAQQSNMKDAILHAVRRRLDELADERAFEPQPGSPLSIVKHVIGCFDSGLGDLSTNKKYLDGYGE